MENKNFFKVETARKTQEQIDRENAARDKKRRAEKTKKAMVVMLFVGVFLLLVGVMVFLRWE